MKFVHYKVEQTQRRTFVLTIHELRQYEAIAEVIPTQFELQSQSELTHMLSMFTRVPLPKILLC